MEEVQNTAWLSPGRPAMLRESPGRHSLEALWVMGYLSCRTDIIADLKEQISELTVIIEQMNRDHRSAQKVVSGPWVSYGKGKDQ